jgi:hypothetical protein
MRPRLFLLAAVCVALAAALAGCGTKFELPTETPTDLVPGDKSYQMVATWTGMDSIADILLTQGTGTQLFLLFQRPGVGTAPRGEVEGYALKAKPPTPDPLPGITFQNLFNPHALCSAPGKVFILDQGDTSMARGGVDRRITDLGSYWRVREYGLLGGDTTTVPGVAGGGTFTDTSFAWVEGIAADDQGRVYVAGSAIVWVRDPENPSIQTRSFLYRVYRYLPVVPGSVPPDPYMPGTNRWVRDAGWQVEDGSGLGTLTDPRGLYWAGAAVAGGPALFAADRGKGWVQKLSDNQPSSGVFLLDSGEGQALTGPFDVTVDRAGFIYVADRGGRRALRYAPDGTFVQRVDVEPDTDQMPLADPAALAADDSLVYVADRVRGRVVRYERRR